MAEKEACPTCGKVTYSFLHSCPGVPQALSVEHESFVDAAMGNDECWECGGPADLLSLDEDDVVGCRTCFPRWPLPICADLFLNRKSQTNTDHLRARFRAGSTS